MAALRLEVFEDANPDGDTTVVTDVGAMEEARLTAYENGYSAGWEDAAKAQEESDTRLGADLAHNLQALNFTFHEARRHVLQAIEPLLNDMIACVLPKIAQEALPQIVQESLMPLVEQLAEAPVEMVINPAARPAIETLLARQESLPLKIAEEPSLSEGQVYLRLGESEVRIDVDQALDQMKTAVTEFFEISTKDMRHE